jgi:tellurite methyltransferase
VNPLPIVTELVSMCPPGTRVLDLGAGRGRNAIFLARRGFPVDAVDSWAAGVHELNAYAGTHSLPLRAALRDLNDAIPDCRGYGAVVWTLVLHLLAPERAGAILANARACASPDTVHAIAAITSEGDFARDFAPGERYYPIPGQVARDYAEAGWEVHLALEEGLEMRESNPDGTRKTNRVSFVIASKHAESQRRPSSEVARASA